MFVFFFCSHWSLVDVPLIFFCPADHVPDWQPRILLGMVEARSVNVKKTTTTTRPNVRRFRGYQLNHRSDRLVITNINGGCRSMVIPEKAAPVTGTILRTSGPVSADSRQ